MTEEQINLDKTEAIIPFAIVPFSVNPHKGYLNTSFHIRQLHPNVSGFAVDGQPISNLTDFHLSAGEHTVSCIFNNKTYTDSICVEDAIRLGGSQVVAGYCFDNNPWVIVVMKDRTYFFNTNTKQQYVENGLSPLDVKAVRYDLFLFSFGERSADGKNNRIVEYVLFDAQKSKTALHFEQLVKFDREKCIYKEDLGEGLIRLHIKYLFNAKKWKEEHFIDCVDFEIRSFLMYCVKNEHGFKVYRYLFVKDETAEIYSSEHKFVGFTKMANIIEERSGKYWLIYTDRKKDLEIKVEDDECLKSINGVPIDSDDPLQIFYKIKSEHRDEFSRMRLQLHLVDVDIHFYDEFLRKTHRFYTWSDAFHPSKAQCEYIDLRNGHHYTDLGTDADINYKSGFEIIEDGTNIHILSGRDVLRTIHNASLVGGAHYYVQKNGSKYILARLSKEEVLPILETENELDVSFAKYGILVEQGAEKKIYKYERGEWMQLTHIKSIMELNGRCYLTDIDEAGQDWLVTQSDEKPVMLPVGKGDVLSATSNGSAILARSPRGVVLYERFNDQSDYVENESLLDAIDTDVYRKALFSCDGEHIVVNRNGKWVYRNMSTGDEVEFAMERGIESKLRMGISGQNFVIKADNLCRRLDLLDPTTLNLIRPGLLDRYVFISASGKSYAETSCKEKRRYFLKNWEQSKFEVEIEHHLSFEDMASVKAYNWTREEPRKGEQNDFERKIVGKLIDKLGIDIPHTNSHYHEKQYYLLEEYHSVVTIHKVDSHSELEVELPVYLKFLNCISFSVDNKFFAVCGMEGTHEMWRNGFVAVYDMENDDWAFEPQLYPRAIWKSFFSSIGLFACYDSNPITRMWMTGEAWHEENTIIGRSFLAFSRSGRYMALSDTEYRPFTDSSDGPLRREAKVWGHMHSSNIFVRKTDGKNKDMELSFSDHGDNIEDLQRKEPTSVAFSPDETKLLSISQDGVMIIRNLHLNELDN